jgi:hypothetical protein
MEVIKLFEEKGTVDEIGIGSVRDALSDSLFPGTSVLHTRARYVLFIPWLYQFLESRRTPSSSIAKEARRLEVGLIDTLLAGEDNQGTIGRLAKQRLKNLPSTMYWTALYTWGLRPSEESQDQYHRSLDRFYRRVEEVQRDDDGQPVDEARFRNWHAGLPKAPAGFPRCSLSFQLTRSEAEYLRGQLLTKCKGTLVAHLVDACKPADVPYVWEHPERDGFPAEVQERLMHARNFSEVMHGAAILYNLMLAEASQKAGLSMADEALAMHQPAFEEWVALMGRRRSAHAKWGREAFWKLVVGVNSRIPLPTRDFVNGWLDLALGTDPAMLRTHARAQRLISERERAIKGRLARLHFLEPLQRWGGSSGAAQLNYRWNPQVARVTADIQRGLAGHA